MSYGKISSIVGTVVIGGAIVGGGLLFLGADHKAKGSILENPDDPITENQLVDEIGTYCTAVDVPIVGHQKNHRICKLLLREYRNLDRYEYSSPEPPETAENPAGNAKSPVK